MDKSIEVSAKTIDIAVEEALEKLGASYDEVDVEILSNGGMFKKAKIKVSLKAGVEIKKPEPISKPEPKAGVKIAPAVHDKKETVKADAVKHESKPEKVKTEMQPAKKAAAVVIDGEMPAKFTEALKFVRELLELFENNATIETEVTEKSFNINVSGENMGMLIGKGGEVLNALQTLTSGVAIANAGGEHRRVYINIENYKERRMDTLKTLAKKKAEIVKNTGKFIKLEPMNARDRAIIHTELQGLPGIRTYSTGKDPFRCLCIAPAKNDD